MTAALEAVLEALDALGARGPRYGRCATSSTTRGVGGTSSTTGASDAAGPGSVTPVLCVDGPAGSGKTTLAAAVVDAVAGARVVHMDDLFEGWSGLARVDRQLDGLLGPLAEGRPGRYRRWDWHADAWAEEHVVEPGPLLVVEGVGSGCWRGSDLLVWVEAPRELRLRRGLDRDGEAFAPYWEQWAADEQRLFARERTRERADLLVDGRDGSLLRA